MKRLIVEFVGTFFFILTIAMTGNALAIAAMLMAWVYIGGFVSGGHYNPMVSFAVALQGKLPWHFLPGYILAQVLGGIAAFAMTLFLKGGFNPVHPAAGVSILVPFAMEILLSFVFALVVLVVATWQRYAGSYVFGFAIGFTIPALFYLGGPISGGLFNPAIALGSMIVGAIKGAAISYQALVMYVGGAFIGGGLASAFFNYLLIDHRNQ